MDEPKRAKSGPDGAVNTSAAQALANVLSADIPRSDAYAMATGYLWAKTRKEPLLALANVVALAYKEGTHPVTGGGDGQ